MRELYLECYTGISGDMFVAALLDLGADREALMRALDSVSAEGFQVEISRKKRAGLDVCDFDVRLDSEHENHDHDMEYLYGKDVREERHEHAGHHHAHGTTHIHRGLKDVMDILDSCDMSERARETAGRIFAILGDAEARAHGTTPEQVHFHEVGAVDSIVDVIAAAVCLDSLGIRKAYIPVLCEGQGTVRCTHGVLPVPVPAVANIAEAHRLPMRILSRAGELITPTGAAIAAAIRTEEKLPDAFRIVKTGMGGGKREYDTPSILRAMLIERGEDSDEVYKLETNLDDCSGEMLGHAMECLMRAGARDVHYIPVYMKKNRPACQLNVICSREDISEMERIIFEETTTIGIRRIKMERSILPREKREVETSLGRAEVKLCRLGDGVRIYPEYESVSELARCAGIAFPEAFRIIEEESYEQFG